MKVGIGIVLVGEQGFRVQHADLIDFMGPGVPGVLATARMMWHMEHAARNAVLQFMEDDEDTVGIDMQVDHTAPTPIGMEVVCKARIIQVDGRKLSFEIEAHDEKEQIGRCSHHRFVVSKSRFAETIKRKAGG